MLVTFYARPARTTRRFAAGLMSRSWYRTKMRNFLCSDWQERRRAMSPRRRVRHGW
ncbi:MAG: hypothetical protein FD189_1079 [Elusimicrobia bacterium]|nr:MAG: hypothetical protein FD189_1079 [Elusimicrobiota bacterium]